MRFKIILKHVRLRLAHPVSVFCIIITSFIFPIHYRLHLLILLFTIANVYSMYEVKNDNKNN